MKRTFRVLQRCEANCSCLTAKCNELFVSCSEVERTASGLRQHPEGLWQETAGRQGQETGRLHLKDVRSATAQFSQLSYIKLHPYKSLLNILIFIDFAYLQLIININENPDFCTRACIYIAPSSGTCYTIWRQRGCGVRTS